MIFILYKYLHKSRKNASPYFECENRMAAEKGQEVGKNRAESGQLWTVSHQCSETPDRAV
jgi:hypothetical protein